MPKKSRIAVPFRPSSLEDVFALYLARELNDVVRVRWYARLARRFSMVTLLSALRQARAARRRTQLQPEHFIKALEDITEERIS